MNASAHLLSFVATHVAHVAVPGEDTDREIPVFIYGDRAWTDDMQEPAFVCRLSPLPGDLGEVPEWFILNPALIGAETVSFVDMVAL